MLSTVENGYGGEPKICHINFTVGAAAYGIM